MRANPPRQPIQVSSDLHIPLALTILQPTLGLTSTEFLPRVPVVFIAGPSGSPLARVDHLYNYTFYINCTSVEGNDTLALCDEVRVSPSLRGQVQAPSIWASIFTWRA